MEGRGTALKIISKKRGICPVRGNLRNSRKEKAHFGYKKAGASIAVFGKCNTIKKYGQNFDISLLVNYNEHRKDGERHDLYIRRS